MIEQLRQHFAALTKKCISDASRTPSAVILPVYYFRDEYYILFIKRTETVRDHKGQISFPGGRYETPDKTMLHTALRECTEEIGVPADKIDILGELDECATSSSNYIISAYAGLIPYPYDFKIDRDEIDRIIKVPVAVLLDKKYQRANPEILAGQIPPVYRYGNEVIWGATAQILNQFLGIWVDVNSKLKKQSSKP